MTYGADAFVLSGWVDRHLDRFIPSPETKALAELSIVLYAIARRSTSPDLLHWVGRTAARIRPDAGALRSCGVLDESMLPAIVSDLLFEQPAAFAPRAGGDVPLKTAFVQDMAGLYDCRAMAEEALARELAEQDGKSSWMYNLTHFIFYATKLGTRPMSWPPERLAWLRDLLCTLASARLAAGHFDIAAELLLAVTWADMGSTRAHDLGVRTLAELAHADGKITTDARRPADGRDEFDRCYHGTLVTLALLGTTANTNRRFYD